MRQLFFDHTKKVDTKKATSERRLGNIDLRLNPEKCYFLNVLM